jgi:hypothetical protein
MLFLVWKEHAMATRDPLDGTEPSSKVGGRPPAFKPEHIAVLHDIVTERAQASLQEIADELHHRCGLEVCAATIRRALRAQGIVRLKPVRRTYAERAEGAKRATLNASDVVQLLGILERFPDGDGFGGFWQILHLLEKADGYEAALVNSVVRSPGEFNLLMINRPLNGGIENVGDQSLLSLLEEVALKEEADPASSQWAMHFVAYQRDKA